jgi:DNA-binding beta-propeller fold protein YncE
VKRLLLLLAVIAVPATHGARQGGHPVALVTAETQNQLLVVALSTGTVESRLRMPSDPQNIEADERTVVVVSTRAGAVTLLDSRRLSVTRAFRGFVSPHIAELSPDGAYAYVTDDATGQLVVIGLARKRIVRRLYVGLGAHHMDFSPDGRRLWIALGERAHTIVIVNSTSQARPRVLRRFQPGGLVHDLSFAPGGRRVWVTYDDRSTISVLDARSRKTLFRLPAGSPPQHVVFGRYAYVTSGNDGRLRIFSTNGRLLGVAATPAGSFNLSLGPAGGVLTSSLTSGMLTELTDSGHATGTRHVAPAARDVAGVLLP